MEDLGIGRGMLSKCSCFLDNRIGEFIIPRSHSSSKTSAVDLFWLSCERILNYLVHMIQKFIEDSDSLTYFHHDNQSPDLSVLELHSRSDDQRNGQNILYLIHCYRR